MYYVGRNLNYFFKLWKLPIFRWRNFLYSSVAALFIDAGIESKNSPISENRSCLTNFLFIARLETAMMKIANFGFENLKNHDLFRFDFLSSESHSFLRRSKMRVDSRVLLILSCFKSVILKRIIVMFLFDMLYESKRILFKNGALS